MRASGPATKTLLMQLSRHSQQQSQAAPTSLARCCMRCISPLTHLATPSHSKSYASPQTFPSLTPLDTGDRGIITGCHAVTSSNSGWDAVCSAAAAAFGLYVGQWHAKCPGSKPLAPLKCASYGCTGHITDSSRILAFPLGVAGCGSCNLNLC